MDGIFVAYHNCKRLFGFQYLPMYVSQTREEVADQQGRDRRADIRIHRNGYSSIQPRRIIIRDLDPTLRRCIPRKSMSSSLVSYQ
jgi:hypothetical protein